MKFKKLAVDVIPIDPFVTPNVGTPNLGNPAPAMQPSSTPTTPSTPPTSGFGTSAANHNYKPKMPKFVKYAPNK